MADHNLQVPAIEWPARWQDDAKTSLLPYFDTGTRLRIIVDDPATAISGTVIAGYLYLAGNVPMMIHDRSGRPDVYPGPLLCGPVLRIYELRPRRKPQVVFAHPDWKPRRGD